MVIAIAKMIIDVIVAIQARVEVIIVVSNVIVILIETDGSCCDVEFSVNFDSVSLKLGSAGTKSYCKLLSDIPPNTNICTCIYISA